MIIFMKGENVHEKKIAKKSQMYTLDVEKNAFCGSSNKNYKPLVVLIPFEVYYNMVQVVALHTVNHCVSIVFYMLKVSR